MQTSQVSENSARGLWQRLWQHPHLGLRRFIPFKPKHDLFISQRRPCTIPWISPVSYQQDRGGN